jgi:DNA invertase Pin-like site-specific DNA recombinase
MNMTTRVAAYCRVSTDSDDQKNSLENQKKYFSEYIEREPSWELVKVYADEGTSGTSTAKRVQFNNMIANALAGGIDLIVTKEVSRFARNTVDTLQHTRELIARNVRVIFINDNIDTKDKDSEFRLTIMASVAQEESRKNSERTKWGMMRRMESGKVTIVDIYGYDVNDGLLTINPEEAEVVKLIYHKYVYEGKGFRTIAQELNESDALLSKRIKKWTQQNISRILADEKYAGDLIFKKFVTPSYLDHKQVKNDGIEDKICHTDSHEPIIDRETWNLAKKEQEKRSALVKEGTKYSNRYWCSGKLRCAECGSFVVSRNKYNKDGSMIRFWYCKEGYLYGKSRKSKAGTELGCNSNLIGDRALIECVKYALNHLCILDDDFIDNLYADIVSSYDENELESVKPLQDKIARITDKKSKVLDWCLDGKIDEDEMQQMNAKYNKEITGLKSRIAEINERNSFIENARDKVSDTLDAMRKIADQESSTPELYAEIIDKVLLYKNHKIDICFKYITEPVCLEYATSSRGKHYKVECNLRQTA